MKLLRFLDKASCHACKLHRAAVVVKRDRLLCDVSFLCSQFSPGSCPESLPESHLQFDWIPNKGGHVFNMLLPHRGEQQTMHFFNRSRILPSNFSWTCLANTYKMLNIREAAHALESVRIYEALNLK